MMENRQKPWKAQYAKTDRSKCKSCMSKIGLDLLRLGTTVDAGRFDGTMTLWHHADCILKKEGRIKSVDDVEGLDLLRWEDQQKIKLYINGPSSVEVANSSSTSMVEKKLEEQNKALWHIKDELKKHVTTKELKKMLEANKQNSQGSQNDLRDYCADGMLYGALDACPLCDGSLRYVGGHYRCEGYISAWTECSYSTKEPKRLSELWMIPKGTNNNYLLEWFKYQKAEKPARVLPPSSAVPDVCDGENLQNLKVAIAGEHKRNIDDLKKKLRSNGVKFYTKVNKDTSCLVWLGEMDYDNPEIILARRLKIPIVSLDYLKKCSQMQKKLPFDPYSIEAASSRELVPVRADEGLTVHEASGLQETGHILREGSRIYSRTLSMSNIPKRINSYYILQIIQEEEDSDCYLFRKWGQIGNDRVGGTKLGKMTKSRAIKEFELLFLKHTGNIWNECKNDDDFKKKPGKYHLFKGDPVVKFRSTFKIENSSENSLLHPQVKELMALICNAQIYRADLMKFNMDPDELPLGKLSISLIYDGYTKLVEIRNLLKTSDVDDPTIKTKITDASNEFYSLIPSTHPQPILDEDHVEAKIEMLEVLWDVEYLMEENGISIEVDGSLDENYEKLRCDIKPLPRDSHDYELIEKYLRNTHGPTHDYDLELLEVFTVDREDERDKYAAYGETLHNKMLLWHGTRLTNVLGILGQGLRKAPKEAPTTGWMFGRGVYFADFATKSASYFRTEGPRIGMLFLAEVALGDMYELTDADEELEKAPQGKHSIKGVGKNKPSESEYVTWRDQVTVPCGRPIPSDATHSESELDYNEYIVYNTAQVKLRFLVKVRKTPKMDKGTNGESEHRKWWEYVRYLVKILANRLKPTTS